MSSPTVADIFRAGFDQFLATHGPQPLQHLRVASAITACRTPALGGTRQRCDHCGHEKTHFHSCRNRHCPQCQTTARVQWVNDRLSELLPVGYFHVVFTVPSELNPFALRNKRVFYEMLLRAVRDTMLQLAADPKRLGADIGFIAVLHTWGQTLTDHPHVHCIVPGGGFDARRQRWKPCQKRFLFPIPVLRALYRGKFMALFCQALHNGSIALHGSLAAFADQAAQRRLLDQLYRTEWVVYVKAPFAGPQALVKYLGAYTHRSAISNRRIVGVTESAVSFAYRDYRRGGAPAQMTLGATEFIRRFMLHVLPQGFRRIRYVGLLAARGQASRLARARAFFRLRPLRAIREMEQTRTWVDIIKELTGKDPLLCPACQEGRLQPAGFVARALPLRR